MAEITCGKVKTTVTCNSNGPSIKLENEGNNIEEVYTDLPIGTEIYLNNELVSTVGEGEHDKCKFKLP